MSNSTNGPKTCPGDSYGIQGLKTLAYCVIMLTSLVGNSSIAFIVFKTKKMRRTINYFIVNMALSDVLQVLFAHSRLITEIYVGGQRWLVGGTLGLALCKLDFFLVDVSTAVSIQSLVLIAVDRFNAVVFPLRPPLFSSTVRRIVIPCTWLVAMGLHLPFLVGFRIVKERSGTFCVLDWTGAFGPESSLENYYLALFLVLALIPFTLMTLAYTIIVITLKRQAFPGQHTVNNSEIQRRHKRDRNILKMAIAIVVGFALCWGPLNVYAFLRFFFTEPNLKCSAFQFTVFFLAYSSGAVNPCICFAFSVNYRSAFKSSFAGILCGCKLPCARRSRAKSWTVRSTSGAEPSPSDAGPSLASVVRWQIYLPGGLADFFLSTSWSTNRTVSTPDQPEGLSTLRACQMKAKLERKRLILRRKEHNI